MSYVTLALLNRARSNRVAALTMRQQPEFAKPRRMTDSIQNVFADID